MRIGSRKESTDASLGHSAARVDPGLASLGSFQRLPDLTTSRAILLLVTRIIGQPIEQKHRQSSLSSNMTHLHHFKAPRQPRSSTGST